MGIMAHAKCMRGKLINEYYVLKWAKRCQTADELEETTQRLNMLPFEKLEGYYYKTRFRHYSYRAFWIRPHQMVPREWTLDHNILDFADFAPAPRGR